MAMTATLACSPTTLTAGPNGRTTATLTVSNSGAVSVNVVGLTPYVTETSKTNRQLAARLGVPVLNGNEAVANGGSTKYTFDVIFDAPNMGDAAESIDVGCYVLCDDGTQILPTTVTITVNART